MTAEQIVNIIETERQRQGLSLGQLANKANLPKPTIASWKRGKIVPSVVNTDKALRALGIEIVLGEKAVNIA